MRKKLSIDTSILTDLDLGLDAIAYTSDPAIELIGLAFKKNNIVKTVKHTFVSDDVKMQIAGPIMIPKDIYRYDDVNGEYDIVFTAENIEMLSKQLMEKLPSLGVDTIFNDEHFADKKVRAYIFQAIFISDQTDIDYIKEKYNYDIPIGSMFIVTQVKDRETFDYLVKNNKLGFSVEGLFKLDKIVEEQLNKNKNKINMKKKFVYQKNKFTSEPTEILIDGELEVGKAVIAKDENGEVIENWSGDIVIDGYMVTVIDGAISELVKTEMEEDSKEDTEKDVKTEMEDTKEEDTKEEKMEGEVLTIDMVKEIVGQEIEFLIKRIAELESKINETEESKEESETSELGFSKEIEKEEFKSKLNSMIKRFN